MIYRVTEFLRSPAGKIVLLLVLLMVAAFFIVETRERKSKKVVDRPARLPSLGVGGDPELVRRPVTVSRAKNYQHFDPEEHTGLTPQTAAPQPVHIPVASNAPVAPLVLYYHASAADETPTAPQHELVRAVPKPATVPPGTLLQCQLVNPLSSGDLGNPIIGIVRSEVRVGKELVVPANSRIFGSVAGVSEGSPRIRSNETWRILTPIGGEIQLRGVALGGLDEQLVSGLPGEFREPPKGKRRRLLAAVTVGAIARSQRSGHQTVFGFQPGRGLRNLGFDSVSDISDQRVRSLAGELRDEKGIVEVPAAQSFHVLVTDNGLEFPIPDQQGGEIGSLFRDRRAMQDLILEQIAKP